MTSVDTTSPDDEAAEESGKSLRVYKYYVEPADDHSHDAALEEICRYVDARNKLVDLKRKWTERIKKNDQILPEFREKAHALRNTPRVGRKPTKERDDRNELRAADSRDAYAAFVERGGSYATWWLAERAAKKAKHKERDQFAGRAGMLPKWISWNGAKFSYCGTHWSVAPKQWIRRPIPEGTRVVESWLQRERVWADLHRNPRYRWFVVFVLDGIEQRRFPLPETRFAAGIDIAWRQDDDTLRVAYTASSDGKHAPIRMKAEHYASFQHAESIQSLADEDANRLKAMFKVPPNTSQRRLLELAGYYEPANQRHLKKIREKRRDGDESLPETALEISEHMVHLVQWHFGQRRNTIASRNEYYVLTVHELLRRHHTIFIEDIKGTPGLVQKKSTRKKKAVDSVKAEKLKGGVARDQRQLAAPFHFLRTLEREAVKFGTRIVKVPQSFTSRICVACNADIGKVSKVTRMCADCGQKWDIDHLAALNLLRWGLAQEAEQVA